MFGNKKDIRRYGAGPLLPRAGLMLLILPIIISLISAAGCCFNPDDGFCTTNADRLSCENLNGTFSQSPSCSVSECEKGCCTLGAQVSYTTARTCTLLSRSHGFEENFMYADEASCTELQLAQEQGACVYEGTFENTCKFTTKSECSGGTFYSGALCSAEELDTICETTTDTFCDDEDVYYKDSCGNRDALKKDCDYATGSICRKKTDKEAYCKDLNCIGGKKNGEKWCIVDDMNAVGGKDLGKSIKTEEGGEGNKILNQLGKPSLPVGTRYGRQYCLNGKIYTEPCSDFKGETCSEGECTINPWSACFVDDLDDCDEDYCEEYSLSIRTTAIDIDTGDIGSGDWEGPVVPGASETSPISVSDLEELESGEDSDQDTISYPGLDAKISSKNMPGFDKCVPKKAPGLDFYSATDTSSLTTTTTTSTSGLSTAESVCSKGDFSIGVGPTGTGQSLILYKIIAKNDFLDLRENMYICYNETLGTMERRVCVMALDEKAWYQYRVAKLNPRFVQALEKRCARMGDCGGKVNFKLEQGQWTNFEDASETTTQETGKFGHGIVNREDSNALLSFIQGVRDGWDWSDMTDFQRATLLYYTITDIRNPMLSAMYIIYSHEFSDINTYKHYYNMTFDCEPFEAPSGGSNCDDCDDTILPCTEYRCKSLGTRCEYSEPAGANRGYCAASDDYSAPKILSHSVAPTGIIPAFSSAVITVNTDETSKCKFDIGIGGETYKTMKYELGKSWSRNHTVELNLPGQSALIAGNASAYNLITKDGRYDMYVRCQDVVENENIAAYHLKFEVAQTPDTIAPIILDYNPDSGSRIKNGDTTKEVTFKLNEPAECKWDNIDKNFSSMSGNFSCDETISDLGVLHGYWCTGLLDGVTENVGDETTYYIRCKDQLWLEGEENDIYFRNTNTASKEYILKASNPLEIAEIAPNREISKSGNDTSVELSVVTSSGADNGVAICKWKIFENDTFVEFATTNAVNHKQRTSQLEEGRYVLEVKCEDYAGNSVEGSERFRLDIDTRSPRVVRAYNDEGKLKIVTNEEAQCKYTTDSSVNCRFDFDSEGELMQGASLDHTADWVDGLRYYIKCEDYRGNRNSGCVIIVKTY